MKMHDIKTLFKYASLHSTTLMPTSTDLTFWDATYGAESAVYDREFARRYSGFKYFDFLEGETDLEILTNLKADILSILTFNKKRYEEMYRVFLVTDADDPITYNYDMTETTGKQHTATKYGATSETKGQETFTKGQQTFTKGEQINTDGAVTNSHNVAPFNSATATTPESEDVKTSQTITDGQRIDTDAQRIDTTSARTDTALEHTDEFDADAWTLTRTGNIGTQTAGDILRIHTDYWTERYKFMNLIFNDICKQLLIIEER